eukprot:gene20042-27061_t
MSSSSRHAGGGRVPRAGSGGRTPRAPPASGGGAGSSQPSASGGGAGSSQPSASGGGAGSSQPSSFEMSEFFQAADDNTRQPVQEMRKYIRMVNGHGRTSGYLNGGIGKMLEPQADSVATLHCIRAKGLMGAVLATQQGTGKTSYEIPAFYATMDMRLAGVRPAAFLVSAGNYDDMLSMLKRNWHCKTMDVVPVLDLAKIPRPRRGVRTLYVIKHGTNARGAQVNSLALETTVWEELRAMKLVAVMVDECASAMIQPGSVLAKCIQTIRGRDGFVVLVEARFPKFATSHTNIRKIVVAVSHASPAAVAKMSEAGLAQYMVYHQKSKYEAHLPLVREETVDVCFACPLVKVADAEYIREVARKMVRRIRSKKLAKVVIAGSTKSDRAHPDAGEVEIIRAFLEAHGIGCMTVRRGGTIANAADAFVKNASIQVIFLSTQSIRGLDQLKIVQHMFWLRRQGFIDADDTKVSTADSVDQESAKTRIRRLGSPHKMVKYWTFIGDASLTLQDLVKVVIQRFRMGGTAAPALTYTDGGDVIEIRGQECWEECIRTRTGDCIRLAVRFA